MNRARKCPPAKGFDPCGGRAVTSRPAKREALFMDDSPFPSTGRQGTESAAEVLLKSLKSSGIDHLLVNPGTDFAPLIEGIVHSQHKNASIPKTMVITHEN